MKKGVKKIISGATLFCVGTLISIAFLILFIFVSQSEDLIFRAPGTVEISIEKPGKYYLWNFYSTIYEGRSYSFSEELPNGLVFSLLEDITGSSVPMVTDTSMSSESGNSKKSSVGYYELSKAGKYTLHISGNIEEERLFSFGKSFLGNFALVFGFIIGFVLFDFTLAIAAILLIVFGIIDLSREQSSVNHKDDQRETT